MADDNKNENTPIDIVRSNGISKPEKYPYTDADKARLSDYLYFNQLFDGAHFEAFKQKINSADYNAAYAKIRYVYVNFAGMISRLVADMLFGEPVTPQLENKDAQAWIEDFWKENDLDILFYESALSNSAAGDALLKLRVGKKRSVDKDNSVILEQVPESIYFPWIDGFNVSSEPETKELAWLFKIGDDTYLRREIHKYGTIYNEVYKMKGEKIEGKVPLSILGIKNLPDAQATQIDRHMLIHVPNWKTGKRHFGYSDYNDLDAIFYAINNRISMVDNVLDKHTDPILMVPPGVIDPKTGKAKKDGRVIEMGEGEDGKPEYIVWDASLENAFKQIDKLVEFMYMVGEVAPDAFGMGQGQSDSGRALKYKLLRTIAKVNRKKLYYDKAIKESLYTAQLLAKAWGAKVKGKTFDWEPEIPELIWQDGLPADETELVENEVKKIDGDLTDQKTSIMKIHGIDEDAAQKMIDNIKKENEAKMPAPLDPNRDPFNKKNPAGGNPINNEPPKPPQTK